MGKTVKYVNKGDQAVHLEIGCRPGTPPLVYHVAPGDIVELPAGYCQPGNGGKSWVERHAPTLHPVALGPEAPARSEAKEKQHVEAKKVAEKASEKPAKKTKKWSEVVKERKSKKD